MKRYLSLMLFMMFLFSISLQTLSSGQSSIEIISAEYRDATNTPIGIQEIIGGSVVVE